MSDQGFIANAAVAIDPTPLARSDAGDARVIELRQRRSLGRRGRRGDHACAEALSIAEELVLLLRRVDCPEGDPTALLAEATEASGRLRSALKASLPQRPIVVPVADSPRLTVFMLRPFQVLVDGSSIEHWFSQKSKTILKALLLRRGRAIANDELIDLVWPDRGASQNNLDVAICHLRKVLPFIERHEGTCRLSRATTVWTDVDAFEQGVEHAIGLDRDKQPYEAMKQFAACCQIYQNELLAEDGRDGWIVPIRQRLRDLHLVALDRLAQYYVQTRDAVACSSTCAKILAVDSCNEAAHRYLMHCYSMLGQPNLVQLQYRRCVSTLRDQLGVAPQAETTELYRQLARGA